MFADAGYVLKMPFENSANSTIRCDVYKNYELVGRMFISKPNRILFVIKHIGTTKKRYVPDTFKQALKIFQIK